mmetsp:Transcript_67934/g.76056  ORF Transcript_67934/g.76056 Transcript_67934/m.76056 type:complete len:275 (+) Transcript_67934:80-904(+)|eukprot:CAMPEP_0170770348 /NCGR_PEP_ID=MMETSP0733-20121128/7460_1 /TAXON_ID=186038 /ORGANISM="Fragilariopsis kerguelensis, Strain L26-C5" /LENGTH=274 /DNA_ID=CAMNT_0011111999 /DNA_START=68 /DNA_END=892 /DNA_ORIENTATION=-
MRRLYNKQISILLTFVTPGSSLAFLPSDPRQPRHPKYAFHSSIVAAFSSDDTEIETETDARSPSSATTTTQVIRYFLDRMQQSAFIDQKHNEHCASTTVTHIFKDIPLLAGSPDEYKLKFVDSWAGNALAAVMAEEQAHLGDWKIKKIREAAGDYDESVVRHEIEDHVSNHQILMYSFVDCPWCVAAKALLLQEIGEEELLLSSGCQIKIIELETLGRKGKAIRAELAKWTGRTSLPAVFINEQPIGGFTDGMPCGPGLQTLHESGRLSEMLLH